MTGAHAGRQPLLDDAVVTLHAPTQTWAAASGEIGDAAIDGVYHGDVRHVRRVTLTCSGSAVEPLSATPQGPSTTVFTGLLRGLDGDQPDPRVRLRRERRLTAGALVETWTIQSARDVAVATDLELRLEPEFADLHGIKAGAPVAAETTIERTDAGARATSGPRSLSVEAPGADVSVEGGAILARWQVEVPARGSATGALTVTLDDAELVVAGVAASGGLRSRAGVAASDNLLGGEGATPAAGLPGSAEGAPAGDVVRGAGTAAAVDGRLQRWLQRAADDLDDLRLTAAGHPDDVFFAAGAPWFFTLFGRDSIWAARLVLPFDPAVAASTLRVLARLQGTRDDPATAEQPGKILHELRSTEVAIPGEGVVLPPLYYGSVDATPLWVCLLADAWRGGLADAEVRALLPHLARALAWIVDAGADGFLRYLDLTGTGLANQGWKDSGDSIQWRDGRLAEGPIALCEVQGYAYEAARTGADLLEALGGDPSPFRVWATALRERFRRDFWVTTPEGRYPAVALDGHGRAVDSLTSNIGHLLGTGILDADEERRVADLLVGPSMSSGYGLRTLSTAADGYWPLSYHGGSVWAHDTAIVAQGMARAGLDAEAEVLVEGLLAAAAGFDYRMPELHSGDPAVDTAVPIPYPAACRPQAWSAAAAFACASIRGIRG